MARAKARLRFRTIFMMGQNRAVQARCGIRIAIATDKARDKKHRFQIVGFRSKRLPRRRHRVIETPRPEVRLCQREMFGGGHASPYRMRRNVLVIG